jgi:hypothetical protein
MFETETVTTRPPACGVADIFPAESISAMIPAAKDVPPGIAVGRHRESARRQLALRRDRIPSPFLGTHPLHLQAAGTGDYVATQHMNVNYIERNENYSVAMHHN